MDAYLQLVSAGERERMNAWFHIIQGNWNAARVHMDRVDLTAAPWYDLRMFGVAYLRAGERALGETLLRRALADFDSIPHSPEWGRSNPGFDRAFIHAALGNREETIAALREWYDRGGLRTWRRDREEAWVVVADDPRFIEVVQRSEERFEEKRALIADELSRRRDRARR
jgi:hypothetical protein